MMIKIIRKQMYTLFFPEIFHSKQKQFVSYDSKRTGRDLELLYKRKDRFPIQLIFHEAL
jgi:hypothetical protein